MYLLNDLLVIVYPYLILMISIIVDWASLSHETYTYITCLNTLILQ